MAIFIIFPLVSLRCSQRSEGSNEEKTVKLSDIFVATATSTALLPLLLGFQIKISAPTKWPGDINKYKIQSIQLLAKIL